MPYHDPQFVVILRTMLKYDKKAGDVTRGVRVGAGYGHITVGDEEQASIRMVGSREARAVTIHNPVFVDSAGDADAHETRTRVASGTIQFGDGDEAPQAFVATFVDNVRALAQEISDQQLRAMRVTRDRALAKATAETQRAIRSLPGKFGAVKAPVPETAIELLSLIPEEERDDVRMRLDLKVLVPYMEIIVSKVIESFTTKLRAIFPEADLIKSVHDWRRGSSVALLVAPVKGEERVCVKVEEYGASCVCGCAARCDCAVRARSRRARPRRYEMALRPNGR